MYEEVRQHIVRLPQNSANVDAFAGSSGPHKAFAHDPHMRNEKGMMTTGTMRTMMMRKAPTTAIRSERRWVNDDA
jgi:hypothetical protein